MMKGFNFDYFRTRFVSNHRLRFPMLGTKKNFTLQSDSELKISEENRNFYSMTSSAGWLCWLSPYRLRSFRRRWSKTKQCLSSSMIYFQFQFGSFWSKRVEWYLHDKTRLLFKCFACVMFARTWICATPIYCFMPVFMVECSFVFGVFGLFGMV